MGSEEFIYQGFHFLFIYNFSGLSFPFVPTILTIAAGALFGVIEGVIIVSFASTLGHVFVFYYRDIFKDFINNKFQKQKSL